MNLAPGMTDPDNITQHANPAERTRNKNEGFVTSTNERNILTKRITKPLQTFITDKPTKYPPEVYASLMNMLIACSFILDCMDNLRGTSAYKQTFKNKLRQVEPELEKIIDTDLNLLWGADDAALYKLQDGFAKFIAQFQLDRFADKTPEQIAGPVNYCANSTTTRNYPCNAME